MEFIICMLLASVITGGRFGVDAIHALKGTTPAHLEKARLKAQRQAKAPKGRSSYANGKPRLRDVAAVYWGDAMADAISAHNRRRQEKANGTRVPLKERIKRFGRLLWEPVGEKSAQRPDAQPRPGDTGQQEPPGAADPTNVDNPQPEGVSVALGDERTREPNNAPDPTGVAPRPADRPVTNPYQPLNGNGATSPTTGGAPTGEAVNYETAMAELDQIEAAQREHLDQAMAALQRITEAKQAISNTQATYAPAANAAGSVHEHLTALHLDQETVAQTGTMVDAMPPNRVDEMFAQLELMEVDAQQQVANAEAALAATANARSVLVAKYGDAHHVVQSELAGDSRFLTGTGATT